jgi:hypothetical protein
MLVLGQICSGDFGMKKAENKSLKPINININDFDDAK